jgi:hypothetical protein
VAVGCREGEGLTRAENGRCLTDGVSFVGLVNGIQTAILPDVTSSTTTWVTGDPMFGAAIDELRLVGASQHITSLLLDNFVLTPTEPAPVSELATLTLLGLGLAGMGGRRWRQRKAQARRHRGFEQGRSDEALALYSTA